jgi:hypothetical protein
MEVSSELPMAAESVQSVWFAERVQPMGLPRVTDEEFPPDLPVTYDWMLQHASQRASRRVLSVVAVTVAALLIVVLCLAFRLPRSFPSVLASPSSSSR